MKAMMRQAQDALSKHLADDLPDNSMMKQCTTNFGSETAPAHNFRNSHKSKLELFSLNSTLRGGSSNIQYSVPDRVYRSFPLYLEVN